MLSRFRDAKRPEIDRLHALAGQNALPAPWPGPRPSLAATLRRPGLAVIAEYKRASPSRGVINLNLEPEDVAAAYARGGAAALSVLTESVFFQGDLDFPRRMTGPGLPLLRKDFLLDPLQLTATAATPAAAALLIVRMFPDAPALLSMLTAAARLGLEAVVEIFDQPDLAMAREAFQGLDPAFPRLLQVNNRDLDALTTDMTVSARLILHRVPGETWISASGMSRPQDLLDARSHGFDAVLVGSSLMAGNDPGQALKNLRVLVDDAAREDGA